MGMYFERMARTPTWIAGLAVCSLAVLAISAIVRSIPASYADIPKQSVPSKLAASIDSDDIGATDSKENVVLVRDTIRRRNSTSCRECGVVTSIRHRVDDLGGGGDSGDAKLAARIPVGASNAASGKNYEMTVRFRDGSTTVLNEATPRNWRPGMRVIVVAGPNGSNNRP
jgi:hypothetical protein